MNEICESEAPVYERDICNSDCVEKTCENNSVNPRNKARMYDLSIEELNIGYVVRVGCQRIAVQSKEQLIQLVNDYLTNWKEVVVKYEQGELFKN